MREPQATDELFDVAIVGAGPAGATTAYYLARQSAATRRSRVRTPASSGADSATETVARIFARAPFLVDVTAAMMQRRGADYMAEWGKVMTGVLPKTKFLRPETLLPLVVEAGRLWWMSRVGGRAPTIEYSIDGARTVWRPAEATVAAASASRIEHGSAV
jgi:glycine/D-amino acid oxidase-like deaminating enzyme